MRIKGLLLGTIASSLFACTDQAQVTDGIPTWEELDPATYKESGEDGTVTGDLSLTALDPAGAASRYNQLPGILWQHTDGRLFVYSFGRSLIAGTDLGTVGPEWQVQGTGNFDGKDGQDILWRSVAGQVAIWHLSDGLRLRESYPGGEDPSREYEISGVGDFDGDGRSDILWRHRGGALAMWLRGDASRAVYPSFENQGGVVDLGWTIHGAGDFNGDGKDDILWRHGNGQVALWHMDGGRWLSDTRPGGEDPGRSWQIHGVGDFNGDRRADILWRDSGGTVAIWLGGDSTRAVYPAHGNTPGPAGPLWSIQGVSDFNSDGKDDILWRETTGVFAIWHLDGGRILGETDGSVYPQWIIKGTFARG